VVFNIQKVGTENLEGIIEVHRGCIFAFNRLTRRYRDQGWVASELMFVMACEGVSLDGLGSQTIPVTPPETSFYSEYFIEFMLPATVRAIAVLGACFSNC